MEDYQVADLSELGSAADGRLLSNEDVAWPQIPGESPCFSQFSVSTLSGEDFFKTNS